MRIFCNENSKTWRKRFLHTRMTFSQSLTVTDEVWKLSYTGLIFINLGLKFDGVCLLWLASVATVAACLRFPASSYFSKTVPMHASCQTLNHISQDNVATRLKVWQNLYRCLYCKFSAECIGQVTLKIGQYVAKIWTKACVLFFWLTVYLWTKLSNWNWCSFCCT